MRLIKNIFISVLLIVSIGYLGYSFYGHFQKPCDKPLEYSIGKFSTQFGVSREDFKKYLAESEVVWEKTLGKDLFVYNPTADFKINLIYDQRQLETVQKQKTEFGLSAIENTFKKVDSQFNTFKNEYDKRVASHDRAIAVFESKEMAYEKEVIFWNSKGGAPKEKFEELERDRVYLNAEAVRLNEEVSTLNRLSNELNILLKERNSKAAEYNKVAENYNEKYNHGLEFNQAEYTGKEINIYQFNTKNNLILAMTHEFGHALGMKHVENPKSIMYYLTDSDTNTPLIPTPEDLIELNRVCQFLHKN